MRIGLNRKQKIKMRKILRVVKRLATALVKLFVIVWLTIASVVLSYIIVSLL